MTRKFDLKRVMERCFRAAFAGFKSIIQRLLGVISIRFTYDESGWGVGKPALNELRSKVHAGSNYSIWPGAKLRLSVYRG
jgi:hypothetical protein